MTNKEDRHSLLLPLSLQVLISEHTNKIVRMTDLKLEHLPREDHSTLTDKKSTDYEVEH